MALNGRILFASVDPTYPRNPSSISRDGKVLDVYTSPSPMLLDEMRKEYKTRMEGLTSGSRDEEDNDHHGQSSDGGIRRL